MKQDPGKMGGGKEDKNNFLGIVGRKGKNHGNQWKLQKKTKQQFGIKSSMHNPKEILDVIQEKRLWTQKTKNED